MSEGKKEGYCVTCWFLKTGTGGVTEYCANADLPNLIFSPGLGDIGVGRPCPGWLSKDAEIKYSPSQTETESPSPQEE